MAFMLPQVLLEEWTMLINEKMIRLILSILAALIGQIIYTV